MTRRQLLSAPAAAALAHAASNERLLLPVRRMLDGRAKQGSEHLQRFNSRIWPETVRDFARCGIQLPDELGRCEVRLSPGGSPVFTDLERKALNLVLTDRLPIRWDRGKARHGVTTRYQGFHLCVIALEHAHAHQIPLLSVNTCVHELLHAFMHDIFESRPGGLHGEAREFRIDFYATRLWLFGEGSAIQRAARAYAERLAATVSEPRPQGSG
jgi:hypothetical protein